MTPLQARDILMDHNAWRRGKDEQPEMGNPTEIGIAIDTLCAAIGSAMDILDRLSAAAVILIADLDPDIAGEHDYSQADIDAAVIAAKLALHDLEAQREAMAGQPALALDTPTEEATHAPA